MRTVSSAFTQEFAEADIHINHRVVVEFGNNRFNDGQVVTASSTKTTSRGTSTIENPTVNFWQPEEAFNNKNRNTMKWLVCDAGATIKEFEDGSGYRAINIDDGEYERGWWSANKSDGSGIFASPEFVQSEFFQPDGITPFIRRVNKIILYTTEGYDNMKQVTVQYKDSITGWQDVAANYTLLANEYIKEWDLPSDKLITGLRVYINSTYRVNDFARISELQGIYEKDISDDIVNIDVRESRQEYDSSVPVGTTSANDVSIEIDNTTGQYNIKNPDSTYYPYLQAGSKITVEIGARVSESPDTYEYVSMGVFWADDWRSDSSSTQASVQGRDFSRFLQDEISNSSRVWLNTNIKLVFIDMMARMGIPFEDIVIDTQALRGFQILFLREQSIWSFLQEVAFADQGVFGFDREGKFYYHSYNRLNTAPFNASVYNLSYDFNIASGTIETELYVNKVIAKVSPFTTSETGKRSIWGAENPSTLGWSQLASNISSTATTIPVTQAPNQTSGNLTDNGFQDKYGYIWFPVLDSEGEVVSGEIVRYKTRSDSAFLECERGYANTPAVAHTAGDYIGEFKLFDIEFDNAPALKVFFPLISAIDSLKKIPGEGEPQAYVGIWEYDTFGAKLGIGNLVNYITFLSGDGPSFKDKYDGNLDELDDVDLPFSTIIAGEISIESTGKESIGRDNELTAENKDFMRRYGKNELQIDNKWIQSKEHAVDIANIIIDEYRYPREIVRLDGVGYPAIELGDRVTILNFPELDIQNRDYHVIGAAYSYNGGLEVSYTLREVKKT